MHKRGQITIFIALGLVVMTLLLLAVYLTAVTNRQIEGSATNIATFNVADIEQYISTCIRQEVDAQAIAIAAQGGSFSAQDTVQTKSATVSLWAQNQQLDLISTSLTARQIEDRALPAILDCIGNMPLHMQDGLVFTGSNASLAVTINQDAINALLTYPIYVDKVDIARTIDAFHAQAPRRLGLLMRMASEFSNNIVAEQPIDFTQAMLSQPGVIIKVDRPYPHIIVEMHDTQSDIAFSFAARQVDRFNEPVAAPQGCCRVGSMCVKGADEQQCLAQGGVFSAGTSCLCPSSVTTNPLASPTSNDCAGQAHGESWCAFDPGVGGRFYTFSCIDGIVHQEPCTDFKLDVCGQTAIDGSQQALCRQNRAATCHLCEDASCCNDSSRDCTFENNVCVPKIPIAFPFWTQLGNDACAIAQQLPCVGCNAEERIANDVLSCASAGDCGRQLNIIGDIGGWLYSSSGLVTTDALEQVVFKQRDLASSLEYHNDNPIIALPQYQGSQPRSLVLHHIQQIESLLNITPQQYIDTSYTENFGTNTNLQCVPYTPPQEDACEYCNNRAVPCTQYACRSLGNTCRFQQIDGQGLCTSLADNSTKPHFLLASATLPHDREYMHDLLTLTIDEPISGFNNFTVTMEASTDVACTVSPFPIAEYLRPAPSTYQSVVTHDVRIGNDLFALQKLKSLFGERTMSEAAATITEFYYTLQSVASNNPTIERLHTGYIPLLDQYVQTYSKHREHPWVEQVLTDIDKDMFTLFFHCNDIVGNFADPVALRFSIGCADSAPHIRDIIHNDRRLTIFTDERATCKADQHNMSFDQMTLNMTCANNDFDQTVQGYACVLPSPQEELFVTCQHAQRSEDISHHTMTVTVNETASALPSVPLSAAMQATVRSDGVVRINHDSPRMCSSPETQMFCGINHCEFPAIAGEHDITCQPLSTARRCMASSQEITINTTMSTSEIGIGAITYENGVITIEGTDIFETCGATIDGVPSFIINGQINKELSPGTHIIQILCKDAYGDDYQAIEHINVALY